MDWTTLKWISVGICKKNFFGSNRSRLVGLMVLLLVLTVASMAFGQSSIGTILGVVRDSSGASVPGATITILNTETTISRTVTTGDDGSYREPALPVGHYTVKVEKSGFNTETEQGLILDVAQDLVVNLTLQVGSSVQQVEVTGEIPVVNTTNAQLGGLVNEQSMASLPLNGRDYTDLALIQPGITQNLGSGGTGTNGGASNFSSNGAPTRSNLVTLDGANLVNQYNVSAASASGTTLGMDGIREFQLITHGFGAEYGMTMGSQMVMVSKGGSNVWHGDAFEYLRNSALDARNFFDYGYQTPGAPRLPEFQRNNFGGSGGGPIKKDKTFFYAVYEGLRQNVGVTATDLVPPAACHVFNNPGTNNTTLVNPGLCDTTGVLTATTNIPLQMQALINLYPAIPNVGTTGFTAPFADVNREDFGQIRVDQNFSNSDSLFGRYTVDDDFLNNAGLSNAVAVTGVVAFPQFRLVGKSRNQFVTVSENHIFSPTLLNTLRASASRTNLGVFNDIEGTVITNGFPGPEPSALTGALYSFNQGMPVGAITVGGESGIGAGSSNPSQHIQNIYAVSDDLFYTKGRHAIKVGLLFNRYQEGLNPNAESLGNITFTSLPLFMQGIYSLYNSENAGSVEDKNYWFNTFGLYIQDSIRVNSKLTVNAGVRYEFNTTIQEYNGRNSSFHTFLDAAPTVGESIMNDPTYKNVSPRFGLAYDVFGNGRTAVRASFGKYFDIADYGQAMEQEDLAPPFASYSAINSNPTGTTVLPPLPFTYGASNNVLNIHIIDYNTRSPYTLQYNLNVDQQLPGGFGLSVGYVGLRGLHLWAIREGNPVVPTSTVGNVQYWATATNPRINSLFNPQLGASAWGSFDDITTSNNSDYNSLQVVVTKHLSRGLQLNASYVYSKSIDDSQGQVQGGECVQSGATSGASTTFQDTLDRGPSCFDVTNVFHLNLIYNFPEIKTSNAFVAGTLHGWWIGDIVSVQGGYPFSVVEGASRSQSFVNATDADRADLGTATSAQQFSCTGSSVAFPGAPACGSQGTPGKVTYTFIPFDPKTVITGNPNMWFNPLMFSLQPVGYLGNSARDMLRGPGLGQVNMSFNKNTRLPFLGEAGNLQFRTEIFNLLNRANFSDPNGEVMAGATSVAGPYQAPVANVGKITSTVADSREIQFSLKIIF